MISLVMRHLTAVQAEPVALADLILAEPIFLIFSEIFLALEIFSAVVAAAAVIMAR